MPDFYLGVGSFILAMMALGLIRIVRGPTAADRMMAAQLLGTGGVAILLLFAVATAHNQSSMSPCCLRFWPLLRPSHLSGTRRLLHRVLPKPRIGDDSWLHTFTIVMLWAGAFFFLAGTVGLLVSGRVDAASRLDQGRQLGAWICRVGPAAPGRWTARRPEACRGLAARAAFQRHGCAAHCARGARRRRSWRVFLFAIALAALLLAVAAWILAARTSFAATVGFIVYGLLLALVWVVLSAVDVALTEAAIGSGVTGVLLLGAAARLRATETASDPASLSLKLSAGLLCALVSAGLAVVILNPPAEPPTLAPAALASLPQTGLGNPVAGVLFAYRALDTLLEKVVVVLALIGVWSLTPDRAWGGVPGLRLYAQPSGALTLLAQCCRRSGSCWASTCSGPGQTIRAARFRAARYWPQCGCVMTARLQPVPPIGLGSLRLLVTVGPFIFLAIGFAGFALAGAFLAFPPDYAKPLIVLAETALTLSIGVTLALLVAGPAERSS